MTYEMDTHSVHVSTFQPALIFKVKNN